MWGEGHESGWLEGEGMQLFAWNHLPDSQAWLRVSEEMISISCMISGTVSSHFAISSTEWDIALPMEMGGFMTYKTLLIPLQAQLILARELAAVWNHWIDWSED